MGGENAWAQNQLSVKLAARLRIFNENIFILHKSSFIL
jgi:hypothetical protein